MQIFLAFPPFLWKYSLILPSPFEPAPFRCRGDAAHLRSAYSHQEDPVVKRSPARRPPSVKTKLQVEALEERALLSGQPLGVAGFPALAVDPSTYDASNILVRFRP